MALPLSVSDHQGLKVYALPNNCDHFSFLFRAIVETTLMTFKLFRHAASLSLAAILVGTALPAMTHAQATATVEASATGQDEEGVSPNPAHDPQFVLANLTEVSPFNLTFVIADEWKKGNKLRATFWYYVWQIRTDAWVTGVNEDGFKLYRNMMSDEMGQAVNTWIAADPALMRDTAERAIGYEIKLPLSKMRPEDMSEADWMAIVAKSRSDYAEELREAFAEIPDEDIRAARQKNGLPVGTPADQGQALPDDWR